MPALEPLLTRDCTEHQSQSRDGGIEAAIWSLAYRGERVQYNEAGDN